MTYSVGDRRNCTHETYISEGRYHWPSAEEELKLKDFTHSACLTYSEAQHLMGRLVAARGFPQQKNKRLDRLQRYFSIFARIKDATRLRALDFFLRTKQREWKLAEFERAQLGNLFPSNAEEAKTIIPSLKNKIPDAELDEILTELYNLRVFGGE
ncbi:hypothetical protein RUND412_004556 [Rhizina undulata]